MAKEPKHLIQEETRQDKNLRIIQKYFPSALEIDSETGGYTLNKNKLQLALDPAKVKVEEDGYELRWVGKKLAEDEASARNYKLLKPLPQNSESKNFDTTQNILIKADNLDAIKILKNNYKEKIKMIYIDPPYNTQSDEFIYCDDFKDKKKDTLQKLNYKEKDIEYIENLHGTRTHSGWLSFMYSRLLLTKDLLKQDGVIFISIDDNEQANLKLLCDEIFGEGNFIGQLKWQRKKQPSFLAGHILNIMEYILVYAKDKDSLEKLSVSKINGDTKPLFNATNKISERIIPSGINVKGNFSLIKAGKYTIKTTEVEFLDDVIISENKTVNPFRMKAKFRDVQENIDEYANLELIFITKNKALRRSITSEEQNKDKAIVDKITEWGVNQDSFNELLELFGKKIFNDKTIADKITEWGVNQDGSNELLELFKKKMFNNPKPSLLIKKLTLSAAGNDDIILDFFAGSGTTAHAVMQLNAEDNGNRKFILVQKEEEISEKSKDAIDFLESINKPINIFEICAERIRRAGEAIKQENPDADIDIGFKIFEVIDDDKNLIYNKHFDEIEQSNMGYFETHDLETILYSFMAADGIELSEQVETIIEGKLYIVGNSAYIFAPITKEELQAIKSQVEYITIYSYSITNSEFYLKLEDIAVGMGFDREKIRIRA